jgi:hypothetical protein
MNIFFSSFLLFLFSLHFSFFPFFFSFFFFFPIFFFQFFHSIGDFMVVRAPSSHTPVDFIFKEAAGYHYCKVLSAGKAMEWIYIDSLRKERHL